MYRKIGNSLLLVLAVCTGLPGALESARAATMSGDGDTLDAGIIVARIEEETSTSVAGITVDVANDGFLGLTVIDASGAAMLLDFIPNKTTGDWAPAPDPAIMPGVFGADPQLWLFSMLVVTGSERIELEPLDRSIANVAHDDVTVLVVDESLVLVVLWKNGTVVGIYYAVNTDTGFASDGLVGVAAIATPKELICNKLVDTCLGEKNTNWVLACGLWLYFCSAV